ncbi:hypothetical protein L208DRAFT_1321119, partial [Tricholoma matsutake]
VINLAMQALITTYSKSKHYNPAEPDADLARPERDEVGLVRAICVKACSSAKHKQRFADIQTRGGLKTTHQLLLDMAVRWSSTYVMTSRAEAKRPIDDLFLSDAEWERIGLFNDLLAHTDNAQQAFSSDKGSTLHLALPALEALHKAWTKRAERVKYIDFIPALNAGLAKITEYYDHTADSDAYTFAMLLDPSQKMEHIHKYWGQEKLESILKEAEETYKQLYLGMYSNNSVPALARHKGKSAIRKVGILIHELSDDDNEDNNGVQSHTSPIMPSEPSAPWRKDFFEYLNSTDQLSNMTIVEWWGVRVPRIMFDLIVI